MTSIPSGDRGDPSGDFSMPKSECGSSELQVIKLWFLCQYEPNLHLDAINKYLKSWSVRIAILKRKFHDLCSVLLVSFSVLQWTCLLRWIENSIVVLTLITAGKSVNAGQFSCSTCILEHTSTHSFVCTPRGGHLVQGLVKSPVGNSTSEN